MNAAAPVAARAGEIAPALRAKIGALEILFLDVDGTMTDGGVYFDAPAAFGGGCSGADSEIDAEIDAPSQTRVGRVFSAADGLGVRRLQRAGVAVGIVTAARCDGIAARASQLGIVLLRQGVRDKGAAVGELLRAENIAAEKAAFMGDDLPDIAGMRAVGVAFAPTNAEAEVLRVADYITRRGGGQGAVREVSDLILAARGGGGGDFAP